MIALVRDWALYAWYRVFPPPPPPQPGTLEHMIKTAQDRFRK